MPTTRYIDENLSFLPSQQSQYYPGILYATIPSGISSSHGSSSESEFSAPETFRESSNSPLRSPDTTTTEDITVGGPYLQLIEPPVESYRFRYPTEMKGTHGSILGISTLRKENARKKIYPSVKLHNYNPSSQDKKVIIRCTLTTADEDEQARFPHVHQLKGKGKTSTSQNKTVEIDDPIDIVVSSSQYQAVFGNMTILYIKKDDQLEELVKKKKRHIKKMYPHQKLMFSSSDEKELLQEAQKQISMMNLIRLNTACLKFEALEVGHDQLLKSICPAIYSNPIKNIKSAQFNDLRICRIDKVAGTCLGREEVFIFVEKVKKNDIRVRFYELNDCEEETWHAYAELGEDDVHYQYAIAFRTPRYKNVEITENVQVYFQLERPTDGSRSVPKEFEYTPDPNRWRDEVRKRPRRESPPIPATVQDLSRPSTSASVASWNPVRPFIMNDFNSPVQCPSSSSAGTLGSDFSSAVPMDSSDNSLSEIFQLENEIFKDFDLDLCTLGQMDMEQEATSSIPSFHSSLNEVLSSFPSGDSDVILQMIKTPDAMNKWASCNGVPESLIQQITSEVTSTENAQKPSSEYNYYETDGASGCHIKPEMGGVEFKMVYAEHQSGLAKPEMEFSTSKKYTPFHEGLGNQRHNRNRSRLTRDNIVSNVNKVLNGLLNLKKIKKIQENDMKRYLLGIFATCVENDDRVLHVLASNPNFPPLMLTFLNVLKMYDIAETLVNLKNSRGQTTLHVAAETGSLQAISLLVESGADVNSRDTNLNTPIHLVAKRDHNDIFHAVGHILEKNPDLTIYNGDGLTALHLFVMKRKSDVISSIIVKSEDRNLQVDLINQPDRKQGNTALHMAVQKKFLEIVNLLLNFEDRIDINARNFEDKTPLAYVSGETVDDVKIEELLIANNADPSLVLARRDKISKELDGFKNEVDSDSIHDDDVEEVDDVDESLPSYAQDWKSDAELKLMDTNTICSVCPVLDENKNWAKLLKKLDFDEDILHFLELKWSPTLYLLKTVAETMPNVTPEILRDTLFRINPECKKAAQFIDDMILCSMGVF